MSFILNALKKAENKGFEKDNVKLKKQVLILKRQTRGKKIKAISMLAILLVTLLVGWFLGNLNFGQRKNNTDVTTSAQFSDNRGLNVAQNGSNFQPLATEPTGKTDETAGSATNATVIDDHADKAIVKVEDSILFINPPVPVRTAPKPVTIETKEPAVNIVPQTETKPDENAIQNYAELPALIKQQLPELKISLHFYHSNPARRIVRINGKILHEQESINDELTVEEIRPTTTVLNFDGYLFELNAPGRSVL